MKEYFRPVWTSGRYDRKSHSAIVYNLAKGKAYFFEDMAADVIGYMLIAGRNNRVDVCKITNELAIDEESVCDFFDRIEKDGLISFCNNLGDLLVKTRGKCGKVQTDFSKNTPKIAEDAECDYQKRSKSKVFSVLIELTYNCSEKCIHCYNLGASRSDQEHGMRQINKELTLDEYKNIIDQLYEQGLVRVTLSGGDPFSKKDIWELIEYLFSKNIVFDIYTNGQGIYGKEAKLAQYFPITVGLSLYSNIPEIHDGITRVKGSWAKTLAVIDKLATLDIPLVLKCCIMRNNCKSYRGVIGIAKKYSVMLQLECNIFNSVDGDECVSTYLRLTPEEMKIVLRDKANPLYTGLELADNGARTFDKNKNVCGAGYSGFCLTPDGRLTLCVSFQSEIGNLREEKVKDVLEKTELKQWRKRTFSDYKECGEKEYCNYCSLCPGLNFAKNGSPFVPCADNCYLAKIRYELVESLKKGEDPLNGMDIDEALSKLPDVNISGIKKIVTQSYYKKKLSMIKG